MPVRPLTPELAEKARVELNEDPNRVESDIQHIKDWLAKQPHLRARTDDQWILTFLRGSKFSLERTKEKLDLFYTIRTTAPELYRVKHTDPLFNEIVDLGVMLLLPKTSGPDAPKVNIMRPGAMDPDKYHITDIMSVAGTLQKIAMMEDDQFVVAGARSLLDLEGVTMKHFLQISPLLMKKMVVAGQDAAPIRQKGSHYINAPGPFETFFNVMKGFLNEKNKSRIHVHKKIDEIYEHIPKELFPNEMGGKAGSIKDITEYWKKKTVEYKDFLDEDLKYGTDEAKRPGKPKTAEDMFGIDGSFRQLDFD